MSKQLLNSNNSTTKVFCISKICDFLRHLSKWKLHLKDACKEREIDEMPTAKVGRNSMH